MQSNLGASNASGKSTGGRIRRGGSRDKEEKNLQHCAIFSIGKTHRGGIHYGRGREPGVQGMGSGKFTTPPRLPPLTWYLRDLTVPSIVKFAQIKQGVLNATNLIHNKNCDKCESCFHR